MKIFEWEAYYNGYETTVANGYVFADNAEEAKRKIKAVKHVIPDADIRLRSERGTDMTYDVGIKWISYT